MATRDWLASIEPYLGELYVIAVELYCNSTLPGRARLIAHAIREIRSGLTGKYVQSAKSTTIYKDQVEVIAKHWVNWKLPLSLTHTQDVPYLNTDQAMPVLEVPALVAEHLIALILSHQTTSETTKEQSIKLFAAVKSADRLELAALRPVAAQWHKTVEWFLRCVHHRSGTDETLLDSEFAAYFERFELHLSSLAATFFGGLGDIDDILKQANA